MSYFVLAGKTDCLDLTHALHVAEHLQSRLPNFKYRTIQLDAEKWPIWLDNQNSVHRWYHTKSPIIWKEVNRLGGKAYLIGDLGEFWEYCYDYYGIQTRIPKADLSKIMADNMFITSTIKKPKDLVISIVGALNPILGPLLWDMQNCLGFTEDHNPIVRLYDAGYDDVDMESFILDVVDEIKPSLKWRPQSLKLVNTLSDTLTKCDLLLVIEDFSRKTHENLPQWLHRCMSSMLLLAAEINTYAKRGLRVVLSHNGPICFNASILVENCTTIRLANIVAVTADDGISVISAAAEYVDDLVQNFNCPPVWGFSGIVSYVDIGSTVIKADVYKPHKRSLTIKPDSRLAKGVVVEELRLLSQLLRTNDPLYATIEKLKSKTKDKPKSLFVKVRATTSLLKLWFAEEPTDDVISLGICSNGSFGFTPGVVFSQAVIQNEKRLWEPLSNFPMPLKTCSRILEIVLEVGDLLKKYGLGEKMS